MEAVLVSRGQVERYHSTGFTLQIRLPVAHDRSPYLFLKQLIYLVKQENCVYWNGEFVISAVYHPKGVMSTEAMATVTALPAYTYISSAPLLEASLLLQTPSIKRVNNHNAIP